ncbi:hypothetical protein GCM10009760_63850 [Kitasatospora kazusensis]|uniref:Uncharacterized protein n=1 Tax=Kitasatospora kazusensis TaxID=407974 RepID=A0ABP4KHR4_9ACTN
MACTLGGANLGERTAQWGALVAEATGREEIPDGLRLTFSPVPEPAGRVAVLAVAEPGCCVFFDFILQSKSQVVERQSVAPVPTPGAMELPDGLTAREAGVLALIATWQGGERSGEGGWTTGRCIRVRSRW